MEKHDGKGMPKSGMKHNHMQHSKMIKDFKIRFIISSLLTIPIILLSPFIQNIFGYKIVFKYRNLVLLAFSTIVYVYGGKPFLIGIVNEAKKRKPGMMTLIALADTIRKEAREIVNRLSEMNIKVYMFTGDNSKVAKLRMVKCFKILDGLLDIIPFQYH